MQSEYYDALDSLEYDYELIQFYSFDLKDV